MQRQLISTLVKRVEVGAVQVRVVYRVDCGPFVLAPLGELWQDCWRRRGVGRSIVSWARWLGRHIIAPQGLERLITYHCE
jgi:hypothetical protein